MTRKVYSRSKNNKYNHNPRYTKKIVQSGGGDQRTYFRFIQRDEDTKVSTDEIEKALVKYDATDTRAIVIKASTGTNIKIVVMINTESKDDEIIAELDKYIESKNLDKKFGSFARTVQSYTIEAPTTDTDALKNAKAYFGDKKVAESPIVKQSVRGNGITVNTFIENLKKIKIKDKSGKETSLNISQSPADGGTITIETPYKIVNTETEYGIPIQDGFKYVEVFADITERLEKDLETLKGGVKKTKDKSTIVVSDNPIKTDENSREYPELDSEENKNKTYISLKLPSGSKISKTLSESGNYADGTKRFTQTITGVGADIIGELKRKGLEVEIDGNDMKVTPKPGSKIDKIVNMNDYGISVPDGTVKYVDVFTKPTQVLMHDLRESKEGILKIKKIQIDDDTAGFYETASFISDTSINKNVGNTRTGQTYIALKLPTGKVEEPAVRLTVEIDDSNLEEKKKLLRFLVQYPNYAVYDAQGNNVNKLNTLDPDEKSEELSKKRLKELLKTTKPVELLNALNDMPPSFSFINVGKPDEKFKSLYKVLIGDNDGLKVKGTGLFSKSTPIITKPTDNPTIFILYHLLVTLDKISSDVVKKNAAAQFFNSLKEIFNSLYKGKEPPKESAAVKIESFIRKLYDPSYSQTKTNAETLPDPAALLRNTYTVALDVAKLVVEKINKSFPTEGGRLTRRRVLNRRNKKKSHRSKLN